MLQLRPTNSQDPAGLSMRLRRRTQRAFTLVEVMIATMVFTMGILGVYAMMIKSYELVTLSRHRDNARAFLLSFSDQFLRLQTTDGSPTGPILRPLFATNGTGGDGLSWTNPAGVQVNGSALPALSIMLGESGSSQVPATVTREITYLDDLGRPAGSHATTAAGWLLQGTFTITYKINGRTQSQSMTVCRSVK